MTLVDTDAWIDRIDCPDLRKDMLLKDREVLTHRLVVAGLPGSQPQRAKRLRDHSALLLISEAPSDEVPTAIDTWKLYARGIDAVDFHMLCALVRSEHVILWTRDERLRRAGEAVGAYVAWMKRSKHSVRSCGEPTVNGDGVVPNGEPERWQATSAKDSSGGSSCATALGLGSGWDSSARRASSMRHGSHGPKSAGALPSLRVQAAR